MKKSRINFEQIWLECQDNSKMSPTERIGTGSGLPILDRTDETVWLEYANDWLDYRTMAEYHNVDPDLLLAKIDRGRNS